MWPRSVQTVVSKQSGRTYQRRIVFTFCFSEHSLISSFCAQSCFIYRFVPFIRMRYVLTCQELRHACRVADNSLETTSDTADYQMIKLSELTVARDKLLDHTLFKKLSSISLNAVYLKLLSEIYQSLQKEISLFT